jgi:hypothetical protein
MNLAPNSMTVLAASGGFGWLDLAVAVAVLAGILILGLFGDRLVGAIVVGGPVPTGMCLCC